MRIDCRDRKQTRAVQYRQILLARYLVIPTRNIIREERDKRENPEGKKKENASVRPRAQGSDTENIICCAAHGAAQCERNLLLCSAWCSKHELGFLPAGGVSLFAVPLGLI